MSILSRQECPKGMQPKRILVMLPDVFRQHFSLLSEAWRDQGISSEFSGYSGKIIPSEVNVKDQVKGFDAVMIVGDARYAPRTVISSPVLVSDECKIPVSWLPVRNEESLKKFVSTASAVHLRKKKKVCVCVLSQRQTRYLKLVDKMVSELLPFSGQISAFRWSSDLVFPEDMLVGINSGIGAAIYLGHGRPVGWVGYYGIRIQHFIDFSNEPAGSVISLCCHTASRRNVGISYAERLVTEGIAASSFGAVSATLHTDNTRWAVNICLSLSKGINTIGELIADAVPLNLSAFRSYRLIGDPFAPLYATAESIRIAKSVKIYYWNGKNRNP